MGTRLVLASASPRRRELLARLGVEFEVRVAGVDETPHPGEDPVSYVVRLARAKARAVPRSDGEVVLAADTTVVVDGAILGKPADAGEAAVMLELLAGRDHHVHTGIAVRHGADGNERVDTDVVTTTVTMAPFDAGVIEWYVATGEPVDKAGGYAIQGRGDVLVEHVDGSVSNVVGLPLATVARMIGVFAGPGPSLNAGHRAR